MAVSQRQVLSAYERTAEVVDVVGEPTRNGNLKYTVVLSTGDKPVTFDEALARKAAGFKGQGLTTSRIEESQKGRYKNIDLQDIDLGAAIGAGAPQQFVGGGSGITMQPQTTATPQSTGGITMQSAPKQRDYDAEALGKTRHNQYLGAMEFVGTLLQAGLIEDTSRLGILNEVIAWADAGTFYAQRGQSIARDSAIAVLMEEVEQVAAVAETPEQVAETMPAGTVQVGTQGLPWGPAA